MSDLVKRARATAAVMDVVASGRKTMNPEIAAQVRDIIVELVSANADRIEAQIKSQAMDYLTETGQLLDRIEALDAALVEAQAMKTVSYISGYYQAKRGLPEPEDVSEAVETYNAKIRRQAMEEAAGIVDASDFPGRYIIVAAIRAAAGEAQG